MNRILLVALSLALAAPVFTCEIAEAAPAAELSAQTIIGTWSMEPQGPQVVMMKAVLADTIPTDEEIKALKLDAPLEAAALGMVAERRSNPDSAQVKQAREIMEAMKSMRMTVTDTDMTISGAGRPPETKAYTVVSFENGLLTFKTDSSENKVRFVDADTAEALDDEGTVVGLMKRQK